MKRWEFQQFCAETLLFLGAGTIAFFYAKYTKPLFSIVDFQNLRAQSKFIGWAVLVALNSGLFSIIYAKSLKWKNAVIFHIIFYSLVNLVFPFDCSIKGMLWGAGLGLLLSLTIFPAAVYIQQN